MEKEFQHTTESADKLIIKFISFQLEHYESKEKAEDVQAIIKSFPERFWPQSDDASVQLKFDSSYDWLMPIWQVFKVMSFKDPLIDAVHLEKWTKRLEYYLLNGSVKRASLCMADAIEWFFNIGAYRSQK